MKRKRTQFQQKEQYDPRFQSNVINIDSKYHQKRRRIQIYPKNLNQENYLLKLNDSQKMIVFAIGPAGTGKTMLAVQWAIEQLQHGDIRKIIITRPAVSVDEEHGFLPGTLNEKMEPWTKPIMDVFLENYSSVEIEMMIKEGIIEISPLAYMRGRTFKDAVIIADECQLCTSSQMKMLLTRIGEKSKLVITGDLEQSDRGEDNGLRDFLVRTTSIVMTRISIVQFEKTDIERHPVVQEVLDIYDKKS
jgi:phosphate starvation-inducible PhoH-like protein